MEKLISKDPVLPGDSVRVNGYIISVQSQGMPPVQSYVKETSEIGNIVSAALKKHLHAIVLIQASVDL